jgi:hypothetical protein
MANDFIQAAKISRKNERVLALDDKSKFCIFAAKFQSYAIDPSL